MFNGVFGHKPTPGVYLSTNIQEQYNTTRLTIFHLLGLIPIEGHYPTSTDKNFLNYLAIGPMVRYAEDLKLLMQILTNNNNHQSEFYENVKLNNNLNFLCKLI